MKILLAFLYFFGSILTPFGLLWLGYFSAPPEFILNREIIAVDRGMLKNPEHIFPNLRSKEAFHYPGTIAGLVGQNDDCRVWLLVFEDEAQAKAAFKEYGKRVTSGMGVQQSSGINYHHYKDQKAGVWGRIKHIDEVILHIEAKKEGIIDQTLQQAGLLMPNPKANFLTALFYKGKHWIYVLIFLLIYAVPQFRIWNQVASWAATVHPKPGIFPVSESELRSRLLAINQMDVPFQVVERKDGKIDVTWRLADAKWAGLITLNKVKVVQMIRLRLSEQEKACRAVDIARSVRVTADGLKTGFSSSFFFARGIIFGQWEFEKQYGLIFKDGGLTFDKVYEYKFNFNELKSPIVNTIVQSGWKYKPVLFFSKILGG